MVWRNFLLFFSISLNFLFLYSLIWGQQGLFSYRELKEEGRSVKNKIASLDKQNSELNKEIYLLENDDKYQEKMIRNKLNFVKKNEILYVFQNNARTTIAGEVKDDPKN